MKVQNNILNPVDILTKLGWGENDDLEFKSAQGGLPRSLWETYSAMANTKGGVILLGVENDGAVSGLKDTNKIKKSFWDTINNKTKVSINLLVNNDLQEVTHPGGMLLAIHVPRASRYQRPVFLEQNPLTGTYRRNYEGDYHCTPEEVSRMLSDRSEEPADSRILEHFTIDDLDLPSLQQFRQRLASHKPTHPWLSENDKGLLIKMGASDQQKVFGPRAHKTETSFLARCHPGSNDQSNESWDHWRIFRDNLQNTEEALHGVLHLVQTSAVQLRLALLFRFLCNASKLPS